MKISGQKPVVIGFNSPVDGTTSPALLAAFANVANNGHDEIHLMLSSPGGSVSDGIAVYNFMCAMCNTVPIHTYNMGTCDSIANVIFAAGKTRTSLPASRFMFHGVGFDIQSARFELKDIKERAAGIENDQSLIGGILTKHTSMQPADVETLFLQAAFLNAMEAQQRGIVDEVRDINLPKGVPILQLVFQR